MKFLIKQFSPASCYFLFLWVKIFFLAPYSQTFSLYDLPLKQQATFLSFIVIKLDLRGIGIDGENWIQLEKDRVQWRAFVNTVINLRVP